MVVAGAEVDGIPPAVPVVVAADPKAEKVTTNAALIINKSVQPEDKVENRKLVVQKAVVVEVVDGKTSQPLDAEAEAGLSPEDRAAFGLDDPRPSVFTPAAETVVPPQGDSGNSDLVVVTAAIGGFVGALVLLGVTWLVLRRFVKPQNNSDHLPAIKVPLGDNLEQDTPSMLSPGGLMRRLASMRQEGFDEPTSTTRGRRRVSVPLEKRSFGKALQRWTSAPILFMLNSDMPNDFAPVSNTDMDGSSPGQPGDYNNL
mmetsp:Transcript_23315/g.38989  ORF Transcript_23315/g.38989 Transcript_23315/m.38989 type:complete len:257 (+) Transcript_23315:2-772(+)